VGKPKDFDFADAMRRSILKQIERAREDFTKHHHQEALGHAASLCLRYDAYSRNKGDRLRPTWLMDILIERAAHDPAPTKKGRGHPRSDFLRDHVLFLLVQQRRDAGYTCDNAVDEVFNMLDNYGQYGLRIGRDNLLDRYKEHRKLVRPMKKAGRGVRWVPRPGSVYQPIVRENLDFEPEDWLSLAVLCGIR
jgi:hypothetical protein